VNPRPGRDTVHVWLVPSVPGSGERARQLLAAAGAHVLGTDPARLVVGRAASGQPTVRVTTNTVTTDTATTDAATTDQGDAGPVWVSLSHGPGVLAVAASLAGPVGIDVEGPTRPEVVRLADRWFDPDEAAWLRDQADQPHAFLLLWTAKEALGKALGTGLRGAGLRRRVSLPPGTDGSFCARPDGLWLAHPVLGGPLVLAVAAAAPVSAVVLHSPRLAAAGAGSAHSAAPDALARSTARSRTSLPVVVRGN
jgi:4'-phosphopantetheinyl transferase